MNNVRQLRIKANMTQEQLSKKSGVSRVQIARIEKGADNMIFSTQQKLAAALGCKPSDLIKE